MAISMLKTQVDGGDILAADWNAEFLNIINNVGAAISPLTADLALGGFNLTGLSLGSVGAPSLSMTGDANTGHYSRTAAGDPEVVERTIPTTSTVLVRLSSGAAARIQDAPNS